MKETGATATMIIVPAPAAGAAVIEAAEAGLELVVVVTEGIPMHDEARFYNTVDARLPEHAHPRPELPGRPDASASATSASSRPRSRSPVVRSAS